MCNAGMQAGCNTGTPAECEADCESMRQEYEQCLTETDALLSCSAQAGFICGPSFTQINGCDAEQKALSVCGACMPTGNDDACDVCSKRSCCAEYKAFGTAPDLAAYSACIQTCSTVDCLTACEQQSPVAGQAFRAVDDCRNAKCPSACAGVPSSVDAVGRYCAALQSAGCGVTDCESQMGASGSMLGCGPEYYDAMDCLAKKPISCEPDPNMSDPCLDAWVSCTGATTGGGGGAVGGTGGSGGAIVTGGTGGANGGMVGGTGGA